jgi:putative ABC transport system permease protein
MFRHRDASDFSAEIEAHVQLEADRLEELGFSPEDARTAALRTFGNMTRVRERWYESGRCVWLEDCWQDLRYALRILLKNPAFSLVAVLTLTLGVGANTAMFSIVNAVLFRPIPFRDSQQLVRVFFNDPRLGLRDMPASKPQLDDLLTRADVFQDATPVGGGSVNLTGAKEPQRLEFIVTYPTYFSMLGAVPQIGRLFGPQDAAAGFSPVVVISDSLWRCSFGADPSVIGRTVRLDNDGYTIIGVLQPEFYHPGVTITGNVDVFAAAGFTANPFPEPVRANRALNPGTIARLKPGLTIQEAQARLTAMAAQLRRDFPADYPARAQRTIEIQPLQEYLVGNVRPMLLVLLGAVTPHHASRLTEHRQSVACPRVRKAAGNGDAHGSGSAPRTPRPPNVDRINAAFRNWRARRNRSGNCDIQNRCSLPASKHSSAQPNPRGLGSAGICAGNFRGHGFVVWDRTGPESG